MQRKFAILSLGLCAALALSACNTVRGAGKDLNSAANTTQKEMNK